MLRRFVPSLGISAVALVALLIVAETATAQVFRRGAGYSGGYSPWSGGRAGYGTGYQSPYYGEYYGPGYYSGVQPLYYPRSNRGRYAPDVYGYDSGYNSNAQSSFRGDAGQLSVYPAQDENTVHVTVRVAPSAEIWIDGQKTTQTGSIRHFVSPPISSDRQCTYEIRARWMEGGREMDRTRVVSFHAGDQLTLNFMARNPQGTTGNGNRTDLSRSSPRTEASEPSTTPGAVSPSRANADDAARTGADKAKDIVDTAASAENFKTLTAALKAAGLIEILKGEGPFTVFAPTDEAFAKLPEGTLEALLKDREKLAGVLKYHVVPGKVMASDVAKLSSATTVQGKSIVISAKNGMVKVDNARVIQADIAASNGVIHSIDTVLMPRD